MLKAQRDPESSVSLLFLKELWRLQKISEYFLNSSRLLQTRISLEFDMSPAYKAAPGFGLAFWHEDEFHLAPMKVSLTDNN